jgi:hypothetical protein
MTPARQADARQRAKAAVQDFLRWQAARREAPDADDELPLYAPDEIACANPFNVRLIGARREM